MDIAVECGSDSNECREVWFPIWESIVRNDDSMRGTSIMMKKIVGWRTSAKVPRYNWLQKADSQNLLELWPASEWQVPEEDVEEFRARWKVAGGRLHRGRMIAPFLDPLWARLSDYGVPWEPFGAEGHGCAYVNELGRRELLEIGLVVEPFGWLVKARDDYKKAKRETFGELDPAVKAKLKESLARSRASRKGRETSVVPEPKDRRSGPSEPVTWSGDPLHPDEVRNARPVLPSLL